jgi:hypothetical protein
MDRWGQGRTGQGVGGHGHKPGPLEPWEAGARPLIRGRGRGSRVDTSALYGQGGGQRGRTVSQRAAEKACRRKGH